MENQNENFEMENIENFEMEDENEETKGFNGIALAIAAPFLIAGAVYIGKGIKKGYGVIKGKIEDTRKKKVSATVDEEEVTAKVEEIKLKKSK